MTIDEVIAKYKDITNADASCPRYCMCTCDKCVQESEQLAEWLEELKAYKSLAPRELVSEKQKNDRAIEYNKGFDYGIKTGYNKAIDDFIEKVELKYLGVHPDELYEKYYPREICKQIKEIAEQLKAGV